MAKLKPIERAATLLGGQHNLADRLSVTPQAVSKWKRKGVPAERCREIEEATGGKVTRYELRPDVFGDQAA